MRNRIVTLIFVTIQLQIMRRDVFQAIADPVRRDIIDLLSKEAMPINSIADQFNISRPAISKHLKILKECDLIDYQKKGRERFCVIQPKNLIPAFMWIEQYQSLWEDKLDQFENYLATLNTKHKNNG